MTRPTLKTVTLTTNDQHALAYATHPTVSYATIITLTAAGHCVQAAVAHLDDPLRDQWGPVVTTPGPVLAAAVRYVALAGIYESPLPHVPLLADLLWDLTLTMEAKSTPGDVARGKTLIDIARNADYTTCGTHSWDYMAGQFDLLDRAHKLAHTLGPPRPLAVAVEQNLDALRRLDETL